MKNIILSTIFTFVSAFAAAQTTDKTVIIVSDWHLSDSRSFDATCYYAWTDKNQNRIAAFLKELSDKKDTWDELVLNGDIFEFWRTPADKLMVADAEGKLLSDVQYLLRIKEHNATIFDMLDKLHQQGKKIVYMPGNHDLTVSEEDINEAFPGLFACAFDTKGTGLYEPFGSDSPVAIEHGNRYEYFNAPYQHGEFGSDYAQNSSLLPPGYFTSKLGATATVYKAAANKVKRVEKIDAEETDEGNRAQLASVWNAIRAGVGSPDFNVSTMVDGIGTEQHAVSPWIDYTVSQTNNPVLFKDSWTIANWQKRCKLNNVPLPLSLSTSLISAFIHDTFDDLAFRQRLSNKSLPTLVCVFGHSHDKRLVSRHDEEKGDVVYLNEGAWVDGSGCTYSHIAYNSAKERYTIQLRQYDEGYNDTMLDCRYLHVPAGNVVKAADGSLLFNAKATLVDGDVTAIKGITDINTSPSPIRKVIENGQIKIITNGATYTLSGQKL